MDYSEQERLTFVFNLGFTINIIAFRYFVPARESPNLAYKSLTFLKYLNKVCAPSPQKNINIIHEPLKFCYHSTDPLHA